MSKIDHDNPPLTDADMARAVPAGQMPAHIRAAFGKARGRPVGTTKPDAKQPIKLRLDPDIIEGFRATGPGWHARMNEALRKALPKVARR